MARPLLSIVVAVTLTLASLSLASAAIIPPLKQPKWAELTPQQREVLAPLSAEWDKLESYRRKKWIGIAQRYPTLSVEEQQRIQRRMKAWAVLSPEERNRAREQYKSLKKAPPEQRQSVKQKWQEYESLPDAEKKRLQQDAKKKSQPKSGAGKTVKPAQAGAPVSPGTATPVMPQPDNVTPNPATTAASPAANNIPKQ